MNTFCISGMGRSGTKFLAGILNRGDHRVEHEPSAQFDLGSIQARFDAAAAGLLPEENRAGYGEVNSYTLAALRTLRVRVKGVIIRDPLEIATSMVNMGHSLKDRAAVDHLCQSLALIDMAIERGVVPIPFPKMTTDMKYLCDLAYYMGVRGLTISAQDVVTKVNRSSGRLKWPDLPCAVREAVMVTCGWFRDKYAKMGAKEVET